MKKIAWGITGAGDQLNKTINQMIELAEKYKDKLEIILYISKAGEQVVQYYKMENKLTEYFPKLYIERDANNPFLAGKLQTGVYDFLLIAPATSNTVAKISIGIADTMLTNGAIQALKANIPVYIMPTDYDEGETMTELPNGKKIILRTRREDAKNVALLGEMDGIVSFKHPYYLEEIFRKHFQ